MRAEKEAMIAEVNYLHDRALLKKQVFEEKKKEVENVRLELSGLNTAIAEKRIKIVKLVLAEHKMTWCTECSNSILESAAKFVFLEDITQFPSGDPQNFSRLGRVCDACNERVISEHGKTLQDESKGRIYLYLRFPAEKHADGFYAHDHGYFKLDDIRCRFGEDPPGSLVDQLADELNISQEVEEESD